MAGHRPARDVDRQLRHLQARFCQLERAHEKVVCERAAFQADLQRLRVELTASRQEARELTAERDTLRRDLAVSHAQLRECERDRDVLRAKLEELVVKAGAKSEQLTALLRRYFCSTRERYVPGQQLLTEVADAVAAGDFDPDLHLLHEEPPAAANDTDDGSDSASDDAVQDDANQSSKAPEKSRKRPAKSGGRKPLPSDLPRQESVYSPPADHPLLKGIKRAKIIGWRDIETLDIQPLHWMVSSRSCPVMRITKGACTFQAILTPPAVIERGQVSDRALVHIATDKVVDHLPNYRQERRAERQGLTLPRAKQTRWMAALADYLRPIYDAQLDALLHEPVLGIDDTVMRRYDLAPPGGACKKGRLWAVSSPQVGYFYIATTTREAAWISSLLRGYSGGIMGDACASHNELLARPSIVAYFCWAHARRRFFESRDGPERHEALTLINQLYQIEDGLQSVDIEQRTQRRRAAAGPILDRLKQRLDFWQADKRILPMSTLGQAIRYCTNRWNGFTAYVDHGAAPIDNNHTERGMRPNALHRKNALFHASETGANSYAILLTLCQSAIHHGLNPETYLSDVIARLHRDHDPSILIPIRYHPAKDSVPRSGVIIPS